MESTLCVIFFLVAAPAFTKIIKEDNVVCGATEFRCGDGKCVGVGQVCDGHRNCADASDEYLCHSGRSENDNEIMHQRQRRQARCRKSQWTCRDGACISLDGNCDGKVDCPDGSDETFAHCRNNWCQSNWFRCTYGACVDGTAPCNGIQECADNSDEYQPSCSNGTSIVKGKFKCKDGTTIPSWNICDGPKDCPDGSDETVWACAANQCQSHLFKCAYGACVDSGSNCNGITDCADGSDETDELCNRTGPAATSPATPPITQEGLCVLPSFPPHGSYEVRGLSKPQPGQSFTSVYLVVVCTLGYGVVGNNTSFCSGGVWYDKIPECSRFCKLSSHPSVEYQCQVPGTNRGTRACNLYEPNEAVVIPECRRPNYYSPNVLVPMKCIGGSWNHLARCIPECGRVTPKGEELAIGGVAAKRGELPWHAGIYSKAQKPYKQICGGTIVTTLLVISAAHCFWDTNNFSHMPAKFAVAAGKLYSPWNNAKDEGAQKRDVSEIKVPDKYNSRDGNYQADIALVILQDALVYAVFIRPICLNFDESIISKQLQPGSKGKIAGWGFESEEGKVTGVLRVIELPYVTEKDCYQRVPQEFQEYVTFDKICAGYDNGTAAVCKGDSGGGLAFPTFQDNVPRYYLRGVVSAAPGVQDKFCNAFAVATFTDISAHAYFITNSLNSGDI